MLLIFRNADELRLLVYLIFVIFISSALVDVNRGSKVFLKVLDCLCKLFGFFLFPIEKCQGLYLLLLFYLVKIVLVEKPPNSGV